MSRSRASASASLLARRTFGSFDPGSMRSRARWATVLAKPCGARPRSPASPTASQTAPSRPSRSDGSGRSGRTTSPQPTNRSNARRSPPSSPEYDIRPKPRRRTSMPEIGAVARPPVVVRTGHAPDGQRIAVHVPNGVEDVPVGRDRPRVKPAAEHRPVPTDPIVRVSRIDAREILHELGQPAFWASQHQVIVVRHQAVRVHLGTRPLARDTEQPPELDPIGVRPERVGAVHPAVDDVMPACLPFAAA